MISLEQITGINQVDRMLPFVRFDSNGLSAWCFPNATDYDGAVDLGIQMGQSYADVAHKYPEMPLQLSDVLMAIDLKHQNNLGYFIGFARSIDKQIRG
jgi:hypothetical protein